MYFPTFSLTHPSYCQRVGEGWEVSVTRRSVQREVQERCKGAWERSGLSGVCGDWEDKMVRVGCKNLCSNMLAASGVATRLKV